MSKRFIDTEIFNDSWFMDLSVNAKLLYIYLFTNCDHAGIIDINWKLIGFQIGIKQLDKSYVSLIKVFNNRLIYLRDNYYFIPKFITFQYPGFPKSKVRQQEGALKRLVEFDIWDVKNMCFNKEILKSYISLSKELDNSYEHGSDTEDGTEDGNEDENVKEIITYFNQKANKNFTLKSKANNSMINARLNEGFTVENFKKIIDNKCKSWLGTKMDEYLRPETLFCAKHFESYLNEKPQKTTNDIAEDYIKKLDENKGN